MDTSLYTPLLHFNKFYSYIIDHLQTTAEVFNDVTYEGLECDGYTLYFDIGYYIRNFTFIKIRSSIYQHPKDCLFRLDFNSPSNPQFRENMLRLYFALLKGYAVRFSAYNLDKSHFMLYRTLFILDGSKLSLYSFLVICLDNRWCGNYRRFNLVWNHLYSSRCTVGSFS